MARIVFTLEDGVVIETELDADIITVGRHPESIVVLPSGSVSIHHATIKRQGKDFYVQDLGTTNGTKLNGVDVEEAKLSDGDKLTFGDVQGVVHLTEGVPKLRPPMPPPEIVAPSAPPIPALSGRHRVRPKKRPNLGQYKESTGCASFLMFLFFVLVAFIIGLHLRHYMLTKRILFNDLFQKLSEKAGNGLEQPTPPASTDGAKGKE